MGVGEGDGEGDGEAVASLTTITVRAVKELSELTILKRKTVSSSVILVSLMADILSPMLTRKSVFLLYVTWYTLLSLRVLKLIVLVVESVILPMRMFLFMDGGGSVTRILSAPKTLLSF